ncbi:hypothetical protein MBLNU459_g7223t1 [Dothideomycetes sp. NU459]
MASPLSPLNSEQLNARSPMTALRREKLFLSSRNATPSKVSESPSKQSDEIINWDDTPSSPFMTEAAESRIASHEWKAAVGDAEIDAIFEDADLPEEQPTDNQRLKANSGFGTDDDKENSDCSTLQEQAKKSLSPLKPPPSVRNSAASSRPPSRDAESNTMPPPSSRKRAQFSSPIKPSDRQTMNIAAETPLPRSRETSFERLEDRDRQYAKSASRDADVTFTGVEETNIDDTCFSTFSAIPEMTLFAKMGDADRQSPYKSQQATPRVLDDTTPRASRKRVSPSRSPSPTPRRLKTPAPLSDDNTTNFLIDFTQQIESFSGPIGSYRSRSPPKSATQPNLQSYLNSQRSPRKMGGVPSTPAKSQSLINLLDFELPPAPTPRSVPTITVRELESMKSSYMSQISSLKATLSGREAEVESLKKAVGDAERRVGEAMEEVRDEKSKCEHAESEKAEWEKRGTEVEKVLQSVREEVLRSEAEKESLIREAESNQQRADENQRRVEDAEARILDLQTKLASARAAAVPNADGTVSGLDDDEIQRLVQAQVDQKIEAVSRELHAVYKKKHETKVATLKKSYEARSEKKCADLTQRVDELARQNEQLLASSSSAASAPAGDAGTAHRRDDDRRAVEEHRATIEAQRAQMAGLAEEIVAVKASHAQLLRELEQERVEKGELVAAVDEMLALQTTEGATAAVEDFRKSIQRPSGLRAPGLPTAAVESRIGRGGVPRASGIGGGNKSMMSKIERMGGLGRNGE